MTGWRDNKRCNDSPFPPATRPSTAPSPSAATTLSTAVPAGLRPSWRRFCARGGGRGAGC
jgi:hypothetical protein